MKKFLIIALAIIFALSAAACGGGDSGGGGDSVSTSGGDSGGSAASGTDGLGDLLSATYADLMKSKKYYMKFTSHMEFDGEVVEGRTEVAYNNDDYAMIGESSFGGMTIKSRMITKGDVMYLIDDDAKTITKTSVSISDDTDDSDFSDLNYLGKGTGTINGRTLPYEEYENYGAIVRFYFDGKDLYAIESIGEGFDSMVMIIEELSNKIPSGMFDIPSGYTTLEW